LRENLNNSIIFTINAGRDLKNHKERER